MPRFFRFAPVLALLAAGCSTETPAVGAVKPVAQRKQAPGFALKDSDGKTAQLSDYKGKVVLLNFWATWCGPCKIEIPWFIEFENRLKSQGFAVVGVAMDDEGWEIVKPYVTSKKMNYRVLMGDEKTAALYGGVESLPTTFVLDRDGKVAAIHIGLVSKSEYEKDIQTLLAQPASGSNKKSDAGGGRGDASVVRAD